MTAILILVCVVLWLLIGYGAICMSFALNLKDTVSGEERDLANEFTFLVGVVLGPVFLGVVLYVIINDWVSKNITDKITPMITKCFDNLYNFAKSLKPEDK